MTYNERIQKALREIREIEPDAWGYAVKGVIHETMSIVEQEYVEKNLRRDLLFRLHEILFDGAPHIVKMSREEHREYAHPHLNEVIYKAEIRKVLQREVELKIMPKPIDVISYRSEYRKKSHYRKAQGWRA